MKINKIQFLQLIVILLVVFIIIKLIDVEEEKTYKKDQQKSEYQLQSIERANGVYTMEIPRLDYSVDIYYGHDYLDNYDFILDEDYSLPGSGEKVVIAGHKENVGDVISQVQRNDKIIIKNSEEFYEYIVEDVEIVDQENTEILEKQSEQLIIYTCYPFEWWSMNNKRYVLISNSYS